MEGRNMQQGMNGGRKAKHGNVEKIDILFVNAQSTTEVISWLKRRLEVKRQRGNLFIYLFIVGVQPRQPHRVTSRLKMLTSLNTTTVLFTSTSYSNWSG